MARYQKVKGGVTSRCTENGLARWVRAAKSNDLMDPRPVRLRQYLACGGWRGFKSKHSVTMLLLSLFPYPDED